MKKFLLVLVFSFIAITGAYASEEPIPTDSRIKTFIYSEHEVFRIVVHYGYQTSIEFAEDEDIQNISVGNNYAWQLTPLGRRLFIKPLEENILTNMTILTNKRAYHLEVQSKLLSYTVDEELVYVVRFFYPEEGIDKSRPKVKQETIDANTGGADKGKILGRIMKPYNFDYTLTGPDSIAPLKIFDDGINTFFTFPRQVGLIPSISVIRSGKKFPLHFRKRGEYLIVNTVASEFELYVNGRTVKVFNEKLSKKQKKG